MSISLGKSDSSTFTGIACGIGAGALWGLVFLAPELADQFTPLELTIGRYFAYGLIAASLVAPRWQKLRTHLTRRDWWTLFWLALSGNTVYYLLLSSAVQLGGIAMTSLVIGFLPVVVTTLGSREQGAVSLRRLAPSLLFSVAGAICIGWQALALPASNILQFQMTGFLCAIGALISWSCFAVTNRHALKKLNHITAHDWSLLTGVVTGLQILLLLPVASLLHQPSHTSSDWLIFSTVSIGVALLASLFGNALWNRMSRLLPLTLVGQMILFETLVALGYCFVWEHRLPTSLEVAAFILLVASVISCLHAHRHPHAGIPLLPEASKNIRIH